MAETYPVLSADAVDALAARLRGIVERPGTPGYEAARTVWNAMIDRRATPGDPPPGGGARFGVDDRGRRAHFGRGFWLHDATARLEGGQRGRHGGGHRRRGDCPRQ